MSTTKPLEFTLTRIEIPVKIDGQEYKLVELDGKQRDMYLGKLTNRVKYNVEGKPAGLKSFDGLQADLIVACLRDSSGNEVPIDTIQAWPARVVKGLYEAARDMNGLDEEKDGEEKKD